MISSVMPSAKNSCSGSGLMLVKGRTAMEGLSGKESGLLCAISAAVGEVAFTA